MGEERGKEEEEGKREGGRKEVGTSGIDSWRRGSRDAPSRNHPTVVIS